MSVAVKIARALEEYIRHLQKSVEGMKVVRTSEYCIAFYYRRRSYLTLCVDKDKEAGMLLYGELTIEWWRDLASRNVVMYMYDKDVELRHRYADSVAEALAAWYSEASKIAVAPP